MESSGETIIMIENIEVDIWSSSTRHREKTEMNLEDDNGWADFVLSTKGKLKFVDTIKGLGVNVVSSLNPNRSN